MSNSHRPSGDSLPHDDHDLHRQTSADASNDADALDARLNEIARNQGSPSTRPTSTTQRPDARTTDHDRIDDAGSLAWTAASFHQQVEAAQARHARASRPDPQLWEKIMKQAGAPAATTAATTPSTTANPWTGHPVQPGDPETPRHNVRQRPSHSHRQQLWNMAANIGLVLALLLAGFGVWRIAGEPGLPGGSGDDPVTPQFAMQPSTPIGTPEATEAPVVVAPPVATPEPTTDCDFSKDIPIFQGVDTAPIDGTAVLLTTGGDVLLTCDEEPNDTTLATGITQIAPATWPGTVTLYAQDEPEGETHISVLSLLSGKSAPVGLIAESAGVGTEQVDGSPWLVAPSAEVPGQWAIIDLRTMESRLLSDYGQDLKKNDGMVVTGISASNLVAIAPRSSWGSGAGLIGDVLIIEGSLDNGRWISLPADIPTVTDMTMSPDGEHLALRSHPLSDKKDPSGIAVPGSSYGFTIVSTDDGHMVSQSGLFESTNSTMQWVQGGEALVYAQNTSLMRLTTEMNAEPTALIEGNHLLTLGARTVDPDMVLVRQQPTEEYSTVVPMGERIILFSVNTRTGDVITIEGDDISDSVGWFKPDTRFLVMYDPQVNPDGPLTYPVVDATTGEQVGEIPDVPLHDTGVPGIAYPDMGPASIDGTMDGRVEVITFDTQHIYLMQTVDGEAQVRQITSPRGLFSEYSLMASLEVSPDGSMLSLSSNNDETRTQWLLLLDGSPDYWIEIPTTEPGYGASPIYFVPGTGD